MALIVQFTGYLSPLIIIDGLNLQTFSFSQSSTEKMSFNYPSTPWPVMQYTVQVNLFCKFYAASESFPGHIRTSKPSCRDLSCF